MPMTVATHAFRNEVTTQAPTMLIELLISCFCSELVELKSVHMTSWGYSSGQGVC